MKDFDFDELDKAVNSVLKQDTSSPPQANDQPSPAQPSAPDNTSTDQPIQFRDVQPPVAPPASPIQPINTPPAEPQSIVNDPLDDVPLNTSPTESQQPPTIEPEPMTEVSSSVTPAVSERPTIPSRRGRFMDMVHPSADMQTPTVNAPTRRVGVNLTPTSYDPSPVDNGIASSTDSALPVGTPTLDSLENDNTEENQSHEPQQEGVTPESPVDTSLGDEPSEEGLDDFESTNVDVTNPFIEGAGSTIEKRPLGGYNPNGNSDSESLVVDDALSTDPSVNVETVDVTQDKSDVDSGDGQMASEPSDFTEVSQQANYTQETTQVETNQVVEEQTKEVVETPTVTASSYDPIDNSGPSPFIAQQYKVTEEKADSEEHGVFDTSNYHQPLSPVEPPAVSKRHIVFWIILILALFIGGGALGALYFLSLN